MLENCYEFQSFLIAHFFHNWVGVFIFQGSGENQDTRYVEKVSFLHNILKTYDFY